MKEERVLIFFLSFFFIKEMLFCCKIYIYNSKGKILKNSYVQIQLPKRTEKKVNLNKTIISFIKIFS